MSKIILIITVIISFSSEVAEPEGSLRPMMILIAGTLVSIAVEYISENDNA